MACARRVPIVLGDPHPMIGKLKGTVDEIGEDHCVIDVHGVGYVAHCPARTLASLPSPGEAVTLFIETYVREDMIRLYGFRTALEREWFRLLQENVPGVGAKVALSVLSTLEPAALANAIALRDIAMVSRAPGVGKKVAERIVTELRDKAPAFAGAASETIGLKQELGQGVAPAPVSDAVSALTNLGYSRDVAANAVAAALKTAGEGADSAKLIRLGLKELAR
jgi:Holliday junction DNA helicase RuvA